MSFLRIELVGDTNQRSEELTSHSARFVDAIINHPKSSSLSSRVGVDDNCPSVEDGAPSSPVKIHETSEEESIPKLKEQLKRAELGCAKIGELYRTYRLRWLEESYRARVLEEYAPRGVDTYSPHQITWDAPSPIQSMSDACSLW
jgi:hypothetical protein